VSLYLKQTISEKFIKQILLTLLFLLTLLDTLLNYTVLSLGLFPPRFRYYSSKSNSKPLLQHSISGNNKINPYYVTGFSDAESSFILSIYKNNKISSKTG